MKLKKLLSLSIIIIAFLLLFSIKVDAFQELRELTFEVQINEDGSMNITENWNIYIEETNTLFKTFEIDNSKYSEITNVQVVEKTKSKDKRFTRIYEEMYHVTKDCYYAMENSNGMFEIAWGVGMDDDYDTRQYQISYTVKDAIGKYNDYSELYWQFIGDNFEIDADIIKGTIILPKNAMSKEDIKVWGHTEDLNGQIYVTDLNKIEFTINDYSSGNYVEVRSLMPNDMITYTGRIYNKNILEEVLLEETRWANEANERREKVRNIARNIAIVTGIVTIFFTGIFYKNIVKWWMLEKKFKPTTKLKYFRELPYENATPAEAIFMMSSGANVSFSASFSANILELCLNKYVSLEVLKKGRTFKSDQVKITLLDKDDSTLKQDIKLTLDFLKEIAGEEKEVTTKQITKYLEKHVSKVDKLNNKLKGIIEKEESKNGNYNDKNYEERSKWWAFGIIYIILMIFPMMLMTYLSEMNVENFELVPFALMIVLLVNIILSFMISRKINVFSQKGIDEKEKWKAFKKYMEDFSLLKEKEVPELILWEKYLVFATAFGISEKVLKQLKVIYPEITEMNSAMYNYTYINIMSSLNIGECINSSVYSAIGSSGSGAGGGFSGGGGGGRWPVEAVADANIKKTRFQIVQLGTWSFFNK